MQKTLGGDRLGSGKKMKIDLKNFERSNHNWGHLWRSSMAAGTLVPCLNLTAYPGDMWDIGMAVSVLTHPTVGPLFGQFKVQLDVFSIPYRLYNSGLHNNQLGVGLKMAELKLPMLGVIPVKNSANTVPNVDPEYNQVNPSSLLSYLDIKGWGTIPETSDITPTKRLKNAIPLLGYWDTYKNYYANKQEEIGYVIKGTPPIETITNIIINPSGDILPYIPDGATIAFDEDGEIEIPYSGTVPNPADIIVRTLEKGDMKLSDIVYGFEDSGTELNSTSGSIIGAVTLVNWKYRDVNEAINLTEFNLSNIDDMREEILASPWNIQLVLDSSYADPYGTTLTGGDFPSAVYSQQGLGVKTYQSDMFNNWLQTEWIDGSGGINEITSVDTSAGNFEINALILAKKIYEMLNQIAVSGGSYADYLDAVYNEPRYLTAESPIYMGGLSQELTFAQVVSMADASDQPLGTLGGRGQLHQKKKGGHVVIKVTEPSHIMGIISLTPRIDYSQGNGVHTDVSTIDDLHKPALDQIGFQELIEEGMAWWTTYWDDTNGWTTQSAGKQPAWINEMTTVTKTYGNFAIKTNEMFMTLNRRYEQSANYQNIDDLTTYIDPSKYNYIFAQVSLDAQNFWTQIAFDIMARRKMSAKVMPHL